MKSPIFVRPVTDIERRSLEAGLRSADAFVLRRCQLLLASARGARGPHRLPGGRRRPDRAQCHPCKAAGLACPRPSSSRPQTVHAAFDTERAEQLRALLHQSPRAFGKPTRLWTLALAAAVSFEPGRMRHRVSGETIRATLARLGIRWQRATHWLTSPEPAYVRKKWPATG
jgi:hypothetical protein